MRIYRDIEMVEQLGSGVPRILQTYGEDCFYFSDNFIRMTFPVQQVNDNVGRLNDGLNVTENRLLQIIELMKGNPQITTIEIALHLGLTKRTILRDLEKLKQENALQYVGSAKGGYWKIITKKENK